jgi:hypothetical protein
MVVLGFILLVARPIMPCFVCCGKKGDFYVAPEYLHSCGTRLSKSSGMAPSVAEHSLWERTYIRGPLGGLLEFITQLSTTHLSS